MNEQSKKDPTPRNPIRRWAKGVTSERRLKSLRKKMSIRSALILRRSERKKGLLERLIFSA